MPRIKSNLTGEVSNVRGDIARELIKMGVATALESLGPDSPGEGSRLPKPTDPIVKLNPKWEVCVHTGREDGKTLCIRMCLGNSVVDYFGSPDAANARREWKGGGRWLNGFGMAVPPEILKQYARSYKENPSLRGAAFTSLPEGVNTGPSNETMAANKEACDRELASGNAHYQTSRVIG